MPGFVASKCREPGSHMTHWTEFGGLPGSTGPAFWPWKVSIVLAKARVSGTKVHVQQSLEHLCVTHGMGTS